MKDLFKTLTMYDADKGADLGASGDVENQEKAPEKEEPKSLEDILKENGLEEEFKTTLQREADKRVTDAVKKTQAKLKAQFEEEQRKSKLTEEQLRQEEQAQREREIAEKLREATIKELKYELVDVLNANSMDLGFRDLIDVTTLVGIDNEAERKTALKSQVEAVKGIVDNLVNKGIENFKAEYLKGNSPQNVGNKGNNTPPNKYEQAKKNGSVMDMLRLKVQKDV